MKKKNEPNHQRQIRQGNRCMSRGGGGGGGFREGGPIVIVLMPLLPLVPVLFLPLLSLSLVHERQENE